jgi:hypothetical protein
VIGAVKRKAEMLVFEKLIVAIRFFNVILISSAVDDVFLFFGSGRAIFLPHCQQER